jgi:MFS family permease
MISYLQHIDWRVVLLAWLACYFLPSLFMGELLESLTDEGSVPMHIGRPAASFFAFFYLVLPPLLAGSFAARFARRLPLLSTAVLTVLGWALIAPSPLNASMQALAGYAAVCLALAMMGVRMQVRKQNCD